MYKAALVAQMVKGLLQCWRLQPWVGKIPWKRELWVMTQCYFVTQIVPALATGGSFSSLLCPFDIPDK